MKKFFAVVLIMALLLSLCGCKKTPEQLLAAADEAAAEEKYTEAVEYLNELLVQEPENTEALSALAESYIAMGDNASAETTLSTLTALQPDNADFVARLADIYLANGKNTEALAQYDKLVELGGTPSDELYELWLSTPLFDIQDEAVFNQKAKELFIETNGMQKYNSRGELLHEINDLEQAKICLAMLNVYSISNAQKVQFIGNDNSIIEDSIFEYLNMLQTIYSEYLSSSDIINFSKYIANSNEREVIANFEELGNRYISSGYILNDDLITEMSSLLSNTQNKNEYIIEVTIIKTINTDYIIRNGRTFKYTETKIYDEMSEIYTNDFTELIYQCISEIESSVN